MYEESLDCCAKAML